METIEVWIGLKKDASTGSWIWEESQKEANFTDWFYNVGHRCAAIDIPQSRWATRKCAELYVGSLCELYDIPP